MKRGWLPPWVLEKFNRRNQILLELCGWSISTLKELKIARFFDSIFLSNQQIMEFVGGFVYRLGREIFILERGVRFPYPLLKIDTNEL